MRKWGIVISVVYAAIVLGLLLPAGMILAGLKSSLLQIYSQDLLGFFSDWLAWVPIIAIIAGQALLLFLSVDTSFKKLKPRAHIAVSVGITAMLVAVARVCRTLFVGCRTRRRYLHWSLLGERLSDFCNLGGPLVVVGNRVFSLCSRLRGAPLANHLLAAQRQRARTSHCGAMPRMGAAPWRLLCAHGHKLRHRRRHRHYAALVRPQRPAAL